MFFVKLSCRHRAGAQANVTTEEGRWGQILEHRTPLSFGRWMRADAQSQVQQQSIQCTQDHPGSFPYTL